PGGRSRFPGMLPGFHPIVSTWFEGRFGTPTEPQAAGWPRIQAGEDTLIAAPTGSGKTLAAFLACLDSMIRQGDALPGETQVVYVSPLKALANDVRKNLFEPLAELRALGVPEITTAVRTGDTSQADRQRMAKSPPHVLVTTPESLYVLLTSESGRRMLATARTAIVDEIHAVARDKRGAHLTLSLERLEALCKTRPVRIGLSATQRPIEETARFLVGTRRVEEDGRPRCAIVDVGKKRSYDVGIEVPGQELSGVASKEQREEVCDRVAQLIGRAAHTRHGIPKARLFPLSRDQLVECAALVRGARAGRLEETRIPPHPLDVLAQQIVAIAACEEISEDALYDLVCRAWPYRELSRKDFDALVEMHGEGVARRAGRLVGARLHRDGVSHTVSGRRGSRLAAMTSGGAIPDTAQYQVVAEPEGVVIGQLDEDFAIESLAGDVFLLGNDSWRIRRVEAGRVRVENAHGAAPNVPFWNGEAPGRTPELSQEVSRLREEIEPMLAEPARAASWLVESCALPGAGAEQIVRYLAARQAPMWRVRWRWNATRSLAVLRQRGGRKVPFNILRMRTDDLLAQVFPQQAQCQENATGPIEPPDHPLVRETLRDCLT